MSEEIVRELVDGEWVTHAKAVASGGVPDPSGEPDGDVLTVASGAAVWAPGGGSQPLSITFTAAEVAARFDGDLTVGVIEAPDLGPDDVILGYYETANDLDTGTPGSSSMIAYTPDASPFDAYNSGEALGESLNASPSTYHRPLTYSGSPTFGQLLTGAAAYAVIVASAAPTTGSVTLRVLLAA